MKLKMRLKRKKTVFICMVLAFSFQAFAQKDKNSIVKKNPPGNASEYVDVIEVSLTKNSYIDVKGTQPLSVDVGGEKSAISLAIQDNSSIVKLKAQKKGFPDANMIIVCKDTVLQFIIRYKDFPSRTYYSYSYDILKKNRDVAMANQGPGTGLQSDVIGKDSESNATESEKHKWRDSSATVDTRYGIEGRNPALTKESIQKNETVKPASGKITVEEKQQNIASNPTGKYLREEVFEKLRVKPVNINIGDLNGGIRIVLDRIYKDGNIYYYSLTIFNREKSDFNIDYAGFEIHRKGENQSTNTDLIKLYQPANNPTVVPASGKSSMVLSTDRVEMLPEEFLFISVSSGEKEFKIKLKQVDFNRASVFSL